MIAPTRDALAKVAQGDQRLIRFFEDLAAADTLVYPAAIAASGDLPGSAFAANVLTRVNSAGSVTLTIPAGLRAVQPATVARMGSGAVTFAAGAGVTIFSEGGALSIGAQYAIAMLRPLPTADQYLLTGRIV